MVSLFSLPAGPLRLVLCERRRASQRTNALYARVVPCMIFLGKTQIPWWARLLRGKNLSTAAILFPRRGNSFAAWVPQGQTAELTVCPFRGLPKHTAPTILPV